MKFTIIFIHMLTALSLITGCTATPASDAELCELAATHLSDCLDGEPTVPPGCTQDLAEEILAQDCSDLANGSGPADLWDSISSWFASECLPGDPIDITGEVTNNMRSPIRYARVALIDLDGIEHTVFTNDTGGFQTELPAGQYTISISERLNRYDLPKCLNEETAFPLQIEVPW